MHYICTVWCCWFVCYLILLERVGFCLFMAKYRSLCAVQCILICWFIRMFEFERACDFDTYKVLRSLKVSTETIKMGQQIGFNIFCKPFSLAKLILRCTCAIKCSFKTNQRMVRNVKLLSTLCWFLRMRFSHSIAFLLLCITIFRWLHFDSQSKLLNRSKLN